LQTGYKAQALLGCVHFTDVLMDSLHLLVRGGDLLLEKLIEEILDTQTSRCTSCLKLTGCSHCPCECHTATLDRLVTLAAIAHCHISFWVKDAEGHDADVKEKKLKWSTPYGRELYNLLQDLDLPALLPARGPKIQAVWKGSLSSIPWWTEITSTMRRRLPHFRPKPNLGSTL